MDPIEQLQTHYEALTKTEQKIADYILKNPRCVIAKNISDIARDASSSTAALVRMSKKLGYSGFSEFRFSLNRYLLSHGADASTTAENHTDPIAKLVSTYVHYLNQIPSFVSQEQLQTIAEAICHARTISIWGFNRTYQSAQQLAHRLGRLGIFNKCTDDWVVMADDAEIMDEHDVCIVLSVNGRGFIGKEGLISQLHKRRCTIILITMNPHIAVAQKANHVLTLPWVSNDNEHNFFEDQIIVYVGLEVLLNEVARLYQT